MSIRKEEVVATIWHDEAFGLEVSGVCIALAAFLFNLQVLIGFGMALCVLVLILIQVEKLRRRSDADKFKAMTYINKLCGK